MFYRTRKRWRVGSQYLVAGLRYPIAGLKLVGTIAGVFVAAILAGLLLNLAVEISLLFRLRGGTFGRQGSGAGYIIWFGYGIFAGIGIFEIAGRVITPGDGNTWAERPGFGWRVVAVFATTLAFFALLFILPILPDAGDTFDTPLLSEGVTAAYMVAVVLGMMLALLLALSANSSKSAVLKSSNGKPD